MKELSHLSVVRIEDDWGRALALSVLRATYRDEKAWIGDDARLLDPEEVRRRDVSWFVALVDSQPAGVLLVLYNPPLGLYATYQFQMLDDGFDLGDFIQNRRVAEIGRFAVMPDQRSTFLVAAALMREAVRDTVRRGFDHYVTDVFEGERHSPLGFHQRVLGFRPVATHDVGELNCPNRRITLVLDIPAAYQRLEAGGGWLFRYLTEDWDDALHRKLSALTSAPATASA